MYMSKTKRAHSHIGLLSTFLLLGIATGAALGDGITPIWMFPHDVSIQKIAVDRNGVLYVATRDREDYTYYPAIILALSPSGEELWRSQSYDENRISALAITDADKMLFAEGNSIKTVDDENEMTNLNQPSHFIAIGYENMLIGVDQPHIVAFTLDGEELWRSGDRKS